MKSPVPEYLQKRMTELRNKCLSEKRRRREAYALSFKSFLCSTSSIQSVADKIRTGHAKVVKIMNQLEGLESQLEEATRVKDEKADKYANVLENVSSTTTRIEELKKIVEYQKARKAEYSATISQQSDSLVFLEEKCNQDRIERGNIGDVITWYNKALGFRVEGGQGVKFIFSKIDTRNPDEEYSFTLRLDGDSYILLNCDPVLEGVEEMVINLNKTNGLFKFVKNMREKFVASALNGIFPTTMLDNQEPSSITMPSPTSTFIKSKSVSMARTPQSFVRSRRSPRLETKKII